mgnify:CR=1 FL=1
MLTTAEKIKVIMKRNNFKISSVKELNDIEDIDNARMICDHCEYSKL